MPCSVLTWNLLWMASTSRAPYRLVSVQSSNSFVERHTKGPPQELWSTHCMGVMGAKVGPKRRVGKDGQGGKQCAIPVAFINNESLWQSSIVEAIM